MVKTAAEFLGAARAQIESVAPRDAAAEAAAGAVLLDVREAEEPASWTSAQPGQRATHGRQIDASHDGPGYTRWSPISTA